MWSIEDGSNFAGRLILSLVLVGLGTPVADVVLEVSLSDELLNLVFEGDAFFCGVADISVKSAYYFGSSSSGLPISNRVVYACLCAPWPRIHPHVTLSGR